MAGVKTVQMTLEPDLVASVDRAARRLKTRLGGIIATLPDSRMGEVREALLFALGY